MCSPSPRVPTWPRGGGAGIQGGPAARKDARVRLGMIHAGRVGRAASVSAGRTVPVARHPPGWLGKGKMRAWVPGRDGMGQELPPHAALEDHWTENAHLPDLLLLA